MHRRWSTHHRARDQIEPSHELSIALLAFHERAHLILSERLDEDSLAREVVPRSAEHHESRLALFAALWKVVDALDEVNKTAAS